MSKTARVDVFNHFFSLPQGDTILAEYIWIGGSGSDLRSKTKSVKGPVNSPEDLPIWNYDGSSTGQAPGADSEVYLKPVKTVPDPFRRGNNILVLCETYTPDMQPIPTNTRYNANILFEKIKEHEPWFGIEQEYTLFEADGKTPLGWPSGGFPGPQGPYYCGIGTQNSYGRYVVDSHYRACLYAGINVSGVNAEVMPGQWEYQVGPCVGVDSGDSLWLSRYILERVCEEFGVCVSFDPKPIPGDWNGAGCHTNFSTKPMREEGGYDVILKAMEKLKLKHLEMISLYGKGNERRLTGLHETAPIDKFSFGVANRGASIRIPRITAQTKKGYFEDRRPASNMDPYIVTAKLAEVSIL